MQLCLYVSKIHVLMSLYVFDNKCVKHEKWTNYKQLIYLTKLQKHKLSFVLSQCLAAVQLLIAILIQNVNCILSGTNSIFQSLRSSGI